MSKNRFSSSPKRDRSLVAELLLPVAFFLAIVTLIAWNLGGVDKATEAEALAAANEAVARAAVQCYAVEGRYPAEVEYLEEHYGLAVDRERYIIHYDCFAENLPPDIRVLPMDLAELEATEGEAWA